MAHKRKKKAPQKTPQVGMGVTCYGRRGRYPATIVCVDFHPRSGDPDAVVVQLDKTIDDRTVEDDEGEIQEFLLNYKKHIWCRVKRTYHSDHGLRTLPWTHKNRPEIFFGNKLSTDNSL